MLDDNHFKVYNFKFAQYMNRKAKFSHPSIRNHLHFGLFSRRHSSFTRGINEHVNFHFTFLIKLLCKDCLKFF